MEERIQKTIAAYYRPCRAWAIAGSPITKLTDHDIALPYKMPQPRHENDNPHTALLAIIVYMSEELFALRKRWRGNALSALARIDRVKQNVLDALSRNLELFRGGVLDSTNQPLTIGALQTHYLVEATFGVTRLLHKQPPRYLESITGELQGIVKCSLRFFTLAFVLPHHHKRPKIVSRLSTSSVHACCVSPSCVSEVHSRLGAIR